MDDQILQNIRAGFPLKVGLTLTAFPAPEWSLLLILRGAGKMDLASVADGASHQIIATAAETAAWLPGPYWYELRAASVDDVHLVEEGRCTVVADLAAADVSYDARSHAEKVLASIEAVIENRATIDQQSYQINNRQLARTPIADLLKLRATYRAQVQSAKAGKRGRSLTGRRLLTEF
jgi:hypothetical protein